MEEKNLSIKSKLVYFLNDINEEGYGMYLASSYHILLFIKNRIGFFGNFALGLRLGYNDSYVF